MKRRKNQFDRYAKRPAMKTVNYATGEGSVKIFANNPTQVKKIAKTIDSIRGVDFPKYGTKTRIKKHSLKTSK